MGGSRHFLLFANYACGNDPRANGAMAPAGVRNCNTPSAEESSPGKDQINAGARIYPGLLRDLSWRRA